MKQIRVASKIVQTLVKDATRYPGRVFGDMISIIARCGVLLILYYYIFTIRGGVINGTPFIIAAWGMYLYFTFSVLRLRDISRSIMQDIQTGNIEILLSKPIYYLSYRAWWQIGAGLYSFLVALIIGIVAMIFIVGIPATVLSWQFIITFTITFIGSVILSICIYLIVGLLAFWIEDVNPIHWIIDKMVMIFGGSYLPLALFPPFMYALATYSPFGAAQFITRTVYTSWQPQWLKFIAIQYGWVCILIFILYFMFIKARHKVSVNGG